MTPWSTHHAGLGDTSLKLDAEIEARLQRLAEARRRSAHWLLREAVEQYAFLADKNPAAALRAVAALRQGLRVLADQPALGRAIEDMPPGSREWPIGFGASD